MVRPTDRDAALWRRAMCGVRPLAPRPAPPPPAAPVSSPPAAPLARSVRSPASPATSAPLGSLAGIDRANAERLKRGRHPIEARLDLHGMTQSQAHRALANFLRAARRDGKRCVLVVTGRGAGKGAEGGVLRAAVPRWLEEPEFRTDLLGIAPAQPRDGGAGALYVMLRRTRAG
jgi:DNA-nicking Smr family endonuclease